METTDRLQWKPVIIGTGFAINLMLISMIVAGNVTVLPESIPTWSQPGTPQLTTDYRMEWEGRTQEGDWVVEHYRHVQVIRDEKGEVLEQKPTSEMTHLRYWRGRE
jgi:hypothetical protein